MPPEKVVSVAAAFLTAAALAALPARAAQPTLPVSIDPLVRDMDTTMKPGDDFFMYANGAWIKSHPIPSNEPAWTIAKEIQKETDAQLRQICEDAASSAEREPGSDEQKVGDFWTTAMDSASIEKQGVTPLRPELRRIDSIRTLDDLLKTVASLQTIGARSLYTVYIDQDDKNSAAYVVFLHQGGLGLPDRGYYFADDSTTKRIREEYPKHVAAMLHLLGEGTDASERGAESVVRIETALAAGSRTIEERRDPYRNYNKMSVADLAKLTPSIDWKAQLRAMGIPRTDSVVVGQPEFFARADSALRAIPIEAWKEYLRWSLINPFADHLAGSFEREDFRFYSTVIGGTPEERPRWKRVLAAEEGSIGELLGKVWVGKYCSPATKARYEKLVDDVFASYHDRIEQLPWMGDSTKAKALAKLDHVGRKVGYPDHWRDFSTLRIERDSYAQNQVRVNQWWFRFYVRKLGRPVDRTEWGMTPQTYNAYYDPSKVEIVLPAAAFLVPGVPDSLLDDAILYSYAGGSTIGHEITHGFDDEGRMYDSNGNLRPWWTAGDSTQFAERAKALADQFDAFVIGDRHVRGFATLGENIADLGGLAIAYDAFKKTDEWKRGAPVNGLTPDQRFFLGWALSWLGHDRPQILTEQIMTDYHAPRSCRVNGPVSNMPAFYQAFGVKPGDRMFRPEETRVVIW